MGERAEAEENISTSITRASSLWDRSPGPSSHLKICLADNLSVTLQGELLPRLLWPSRLLGPRQMGSNSVLMRRNRSDSEVEVRQSHMLASEGLPVSASLFVTLLLATLNFHPESPKLLTPC